MNPNEPGKTFRFADFSISRERQILTRGSENIHISTKLYHLLLVLVENAGRILSKDELIDAAWHGQIVTDGTLSRAMTRLRQLIGDRDVDNPIIETHRGMGYRFALPVHEEITEPEAVVPDMPEATRFMPAAYNRAVWVGIFLLLLLGSGYLLREKPGNPPVTGREAAAINVAVLPRTEPADWLNQGGKTFLVEELRKNPSIHAVSPTLPDHSDDNPELLAIRLSANSRVDYSSLIAFEKTAEGYSANLSLRDENGVLASGELQASDLPELLQATSRWISTKLEVHDRLSQASFMDSGSSDAYALRSYFQGIYEIETTGNLKRARDFFEAAVNKDPEFLHAWSRLAAVFLELGKFQKAAAIAKTQLEQHNNIEPVLRIRFNSILADAWYRLRDEDKAQQALAQAAMAINETDDPFVRLAGLDTLIFQSSLKKDYEASVKYTQQAIKISERYLPLPNKLALLYKKLGIIQGLEKDFKLALGNLEKALEIYRNNGNYNGVISTYCQINNIRYSLDQVDNIVQSILSVKQFFQGSNDHYAKACYMLYTGLALNLRGLFSVSNEYIKTLQDIASNTGNEFFTILAGVLRIHGYYVQNKLEQSAAELENIAILLKNKSKFPSLQSAFFGFYILVSSRVDPVALARKKINDYLEQYPKAMDDPKAAPNISRALGHIAVRSGHVEEGLKLLSEAEKGRREIFEISVANYIGMEILQILLAHPELEYRETLARLEQEMDYYYLFYKLMAGFLAREGNYRQATLLMEENKLKANEFWTEKDQLLLEHYKRRAQPSLEASSPGG